MATILSTIKSALRNDSVAESGKDIIVKSKDRENAKKTLETYLKSKNVEFNSVFMKSKSHSIDVLKIPGLSGYVVFKPLIQKGAGGIGFEKELEVDLNNYFNGTDVSQLKHGDVVEKMQNVLGLKQIKSYKVLHEGSKNQKRTLTFSGNQLSITNSSGQTLTDITLEDPKSNKIYLSLKMSQSYYVLSASIGKYFSDPTYNTKLCEYLGMNGQKMGGFGKEYTCVTKKPNYNVVKTHLQDLLSEACGNNVVLIHKKRQGDVIVDNVKASNKVSISSLDDDSYVYPEAGVRKYAVIKFDAKINQHSYKVSFQFRGTTPTDVGPKYLRILMERV